jgi:hypothetical protein
VTQSGADHGASLTCMVYDINLFMRNATAQSTTDVGDVRVDHDRLRYVTRLLGSPPGLNTALLGTVVFLSSNIDEVSHWLTGWWRLLVVLAWLALLVACLRIYIAAQEWIPEYYKRRFGSVQAARKPWSKWDALFFLALPVLLFIGWPIAHYLDPVASTFLGHLHMLISDPARQINLWPSLIWVALLCAGLRRPMSSIERQRVYFMLVATLGFASIVSYAILHPDAKQLGLWKIMNTGGLGLSLVALGLYDYISLVLLLPKAVAEGDNE